MGIISKWKNFQEGQKSKKIEKYGKTLRNSKAIKEDRQAAIQYFADAKDPAIAIPNLLTRFDYSLEHGINDTREKETCMEGIVKHGEDAIPFVQKHISNTTRIAWPIKVLKDLKQEDKLVDILFESLDFGDISFDQAKVDKNYDILCYLIDYDVSKYIDQLTVFLQNPDERVRFACSELLIEQKHDDVPLALEQFLEDASSENTRIRQTVIDAFVKNGWKVRDPSKYTHGQVANGVKLNKEGQLTRPQ